MKVVKYCLSLHEIPEGAKRPFQWSMEAKISKGMGECLGKCTTVALTE